jgi:hypothetical protein
MAVAGSFIYAPTFPGHSLTASEHAGRLGPVGNRSNDNEVIASVVR